MVRLVFLGPGMPAGFPPDEHMRKRSRSKRPPILLSPKGCKMLAQGNALGVALKLWVQALKGRKRLPVAPFQGWARAQHEPYPRALPWAELLPPFRRVVENPSAL